jgi:beta-glucosidase
MHDATPTTELALPPGFLFGTSTSAHQVEGNNVASDWWAYENRDGSPAGEPSGDACDSFERWREDMDMLRDLGFNAYRFGIEWARVQPVRGRVSRAAVLHYAEMVAYARRIGLEPVVTLHHFTHPLWFTRNGGWTAPDAVALFEEYVRAVAPVIDAGARTVVTINEPNILAIMQAVAHEGATLEAGLGGGLPEPHRPTAEALGHAHSAARTLLRERHPGVGVGWSVANQAVQSASGGEELARQYRYSREDWYLEQSRGDDFVGVQSYTRTVFGPDGIVPPADDVERTITGWEYYPAAVGEALRHTRSVVGDLPLIVTENGIATADDERRIDYTTGALHAVSAAMADGVDVRGYLHWSALDNYEWGSWKPTFGLVAVDHETFARTPKPSAYWLGDLARRLVVPGVGAEETVVAR